MIDLPCEECYEANRTCCVTDIVLNVPDAMLMMKHAKRLGKDIILGWHINEGCEQMFMMIPRKPDVNVRIEPCVFLNSAGKCDIYEDRPSICRMYGEPEMRCRYEFAGIRTAEEILGLSNEDILILDEEAMKGSDMNIFENLRNFKQS